MRDLKRDIKRLLFNPLKSAYYVGFLAEEDMIKSIEERYQRIKWMNVNEYEDEGWFADPFILSVKDNIIELFAEEMIYRTGRGIIVYLKVDKESCKIQEREIMLELETHLSFPIYIEEGGTIYVYPENYQSGEVRIYEYDEKTKKLSNPRTIIKEPLLDVQIVKIGNNYYAFGVRFRTGSQIDTKELIVYQSDSLLGKYELIQIIENERCEERGAGLIYCECERLIRPAQCCEGGYGREVILYELRRDGMGVSEMEFERVVPDRNAQKGKVLHTFNKKNGVVVIDGFAYQYPLIASWYKKLRGIRD